MFSHINIVISGDWAGGAAAQARDLVTRLTQLSDYQTKWKLITVQLGGNDVCSYSCGPEDASPQAFQVLRDKLSLYSPAPARITSRRCWRSCPRLYQTASSFCWRTWTSHATPQYRTEDSSATSCLPSAAPVCLMATRNRTRCPSGTCWPTTRPSISSLQPRSV